MKAKHSSTALQTQQWHFAVSSPTMKCPQEASFQVNNDGSLSVRSSSLKATMKQAQLPIEQAQRQWKISFIDLGYQDLVRGHIQLCIFLLYDQKRLFVQISVSLQHFGRVCLQIWLTFRNSV